MRSPSLRHELAGDDGFILVAVLWILSALAALTIIYALYMRQTALQSLGYNERLQARALGIAGVELAAYRLTARQDTRPVLGHLNFLQGAATITVAYNSENSFIDLNFAPKNVLAGLFIGFGVPEEDALAYADRIIAWRTPLQQGAGDTEADIYRAAGKIYGPRHGAFQQTNELGLVADLPPALVDRVLPYFTVYSGEPQVNVLSAPPQVLAAVPGLTPDRLQTLMSMRADTPQDVVRAQLGIATTSVTMSPSAADRVEVNVQFPTGDRFRSEADILLVSGDHDPYRVLSWHDDVLPASADTVPQ